VIHITPRPAGHIEVVGSVAKCWRRIRCSTSVLAFAYRAVFTAQVIEIGGIYGGIPGVE